MKAIVLVARGLQSAYLGCLGNDWVMTHALDKFATQGVLFEQHFSTSPTDWGARALWRWGATDPKAGHDLLARVHALQGQAVLVCDASKPLPEAFLVGWDAVHQVPDELDDGQTSTERTVRQALALVQKLRDTAHWLLWVEFATLLPPWDIPDEFLQPYCLPVTEEPSAYAKDADDSRDELAAMEESIDELEELTEEELGPDESLEWDLDEDEALAEQSSDDGAPAVAIAERVNTPSEVKNLSEPEPTDAFDDDNDDNDDAGFIPPLYAPQVGPLPEPKDETFIRLQRTYAGAVSLLDAGLELFFDELQAEPSVQEILQVVVSDVGFALGEHEQVGGSTPWLYEEVVHVPLCVRLPKDQEAGVRVPELTQSSDLHALLSLAFEQPTSLPASLAEWSKTRAAGRPALYLALAQEQAKCSGWRTTERYFLLYEGLGGAAGENVRQLYVKPDDRWELNNIVQQEFELSEAYEQQLRAVQ